MFGYFIDCKTITHGTTKARRSSFEFPTDDWCFCDSIVYSVGLGGCILKARLTMANQTTDHDV
jgi:hypothetical protein